MSVTFTFKRELKCFVMFYVSPCHQAHLRFGMFSEKDSMLILSMISNNCTLKLHKQHSAQGFLFVDEIS